MIGCGVPSIKAPNLEQAPTSVPQLSVPAGTVLLSKEKPVTGSDDFPIIGELSYLTDGDKEAGEGYFTEFMDGVQWVQIDLEQSSAIAAVWVWHYHSQKRAYHDVIIQISDDPEFASGVTTLFNNDYDNSASLGKGKNNPYVESRFGKLVPRMILPKRSAYTSASRPTMRMTIRSSGSATKSCNRKKPRSRP